MTLLNLLIGVSLIACAFSQCSKKHEDETSWVCPCGCKEGCSCDCTKETCRCTSGECHCSEN